MNSKTCFENNAPDVNYLLITPSRWRYLNAARSNLATVKHFSGTADPFLQFCKL
jgi:hypothetical protein